MILFTGKVPPGQNFTTENEAIASALKNRFHAIKEHVFNVYYYGILSYEDVSQRKHTTTFCLYIGDITTSNPPSLNICPEFNRMD
jgi:hypothetical protein